MTALLQDQPGCTCPVIEVNVQGELDVSVVPRLREQLIDALSLAPTRLVVDLSACTFFDVSGINLLLEVHRQIWQQDGRLTLRNAQPRHLRLLALMGLRDVFDLEGAACINHDDGHEVRPRTPANDALGTARVPHQPTEEMS
ncbi:MAG: STAS domain-containing protein [Mycobacteriales bacterium]